MELATLSNTASFVKGSLMYFDPMCNEMAVVAFLIVTDTLARDSPKAFAVCLNLPLSEG